MSDKNKYNRAYDNGYNDGKKADGLDQICHNTVKGVSLGDDTNDSYNAGYSDGVKDKGNSNNSNYSGGTSESSGK